ncbi:hypothetical protein BSL78_02694 [Apostichopus japonicus]|uniref:Uncharacterized protein n=1 Tax=Stichopus japonicus TaxID=307972 RepID=A0A2G8LJF4_STIJA|nr:hypothetical protein BSL78_02694 [Apostichopus japonicus]
MRNTLTAQITDFSDEVAMAKMELRQAAEEVERNIGSFSPDIDASIPKRGCQEGIEERDGQPLFHFGFKDASRIQVINVIAVIDMTSCEIINSPLVPVGGRKGGESIQGSMWTGHMFGSGEEDDEDILLHLFCEHLAEGKTGEHATHDGHQRRGDAGNPRGDGEARIGALRGEEEYGKGMKHLKGSRESLPERGEEPNGNPTRRLLRPRALKLLP